MNKDLTRFFVPRDVTLYDVMRHINETAHGFALIVDQHGRLVNTVTDGDLRRAVLRGVDLTSRAEDLKGDQRATTLPFGTPRDEVQARMRELKLRQIPLVDETDRVCDVVQLDDLLTDVKHEFAATAVIMAGGFGKRLRPLTDDTPKPLLKIGDKPLMEGTVERLRDAGISQFHVATHYKPEAFTDHFGNGDAFGVKINYIREDSPLGTAGVLAMLPECKEPLLVINGDILTSVNFKALFAFHRECMAEMTVCVRRYDYEVPYGVVETDGTIIKGIKEKPTHRLFVNAGVYLLEPSVRENLPTSRHFDMTDVVALLLSLDLRVAAFPISEYWLDIGQIADYERAQADVADGKTSL